MASDEGNEGKDLALDRKYDFEQEMNKLLEANKEGTNVVFNNFIYNIVRNDEGSLEIKAGDLTIATITDGNYEYNIANLRILRDSIEKDGVAKYEDLGLPDLEYLMYLDKENKEEGVDTPENPEEGVDIPENPEEGVDTPENLNDGEEVIIKSDDNNKSDKLARKSDWIKLDGTVEVTKSKTVMDLIPGANKYSAIYVAPSEDYHTYTFMGQISGTNEYEKIDSLEMTEGTNPTQSILSLDASQSTGETKQSLMMVKIKGREDEGFSIVHSTPHDGVGVNYWRKPLSDDMYISTTIPRDGRDGQYDDVSINTKYLMSEEMTSDRELEEILEHSDNMESISERDLPEEIDPTADGKQLVELNIAEFKAIMKEKVENFLRAESNDHPDLIKLKAEKIVNTIVDDGKNFLEAKEEVERSAREQGGFTPADASLRGGE